MTRTLPLILRDHEVRAVLAGRKTRHTVPIKLREFDYKNDGHPIPWSWRNRKGTLCIASDEYLQAKVLPFRVGDVLWVREAWAAFTTPHHEYGDCDLIECAPSEMRSEVQWVHENDLVYRADGKSRPDRWRSAATMPRWASRITLTVTDVSVRRLWDTTEDDAKAHGCRAHDAHIVIQAGAGIRADMSNTALGALACAWDAEHSKHYPWHSNPWVESFTFRVEERAR